MLFRSVLNHIENLHLDSFFCIFSDSDKRNFPAKNRITPILNINIKNRGDFTVKTICNQLIIKQFLFTKFPQLANNIIPILKNPVSCQFLNKHLKTRLKRKVSFAYVVVKRPVDSVNPFNHNFGMSFVKTA